MPEEDQADQPSNDSKEPVTTEETSEQPEKQGEEKLIKSFPQEKSSNMRTVVIIIAILVAGVGSGYALSSVQGGPKGLKSTEEATEEGIKVGDVFGIADEKTFRDESEGIIVKGGIDGEGSHHLIRPGGESQNVYLTSSVVDLDLFEDHKVKIWGETFSAQKAGWLMDAGRIKVLELNSPKPEDSD